MQPRLDRADLELLLAIREHGSLAGRGSRCRRGALRDHQAPCRARGPAGPASCSSAPPGRRQSRRAEGEAAVRHARSACSTASPALGSGTAANASSEPVGRIRLAATFGFGRRLAGPCARRLPGSATRSLAIQLQLTEQLPDLAVEGFDGAVWLWAVRGQRASRAGPAGGSRATSACWSRRRSYLRQRGTPAALEELAAHDCLVVRENETRRRLAPAARSVIARDGTRARAAGRCPATRASWCATGAWPGRGIMLRSLWDIAGAARQRRTRARAARLRDAAMRTSTGSRRTRPRRPSASGCWSISSPSAFAPSPGSSRPRAERTTRLTPTAVSAMPATVNSGDRFAEQQPGHHGRARRHQVHAGW